MKLNRIGSLWDPFSEGLEFYGTQVYIVMSEVLSMGMIDDEGMVFPVLTGESLVATELQTESLSTGG